MELASYLTNPESARDRYILHTIRSTLTPAALALDEHARSFYVGIEYKTGCLHPASELEGYPIRVDLLDAERLSLLDRYHDFQPARYDALAKKLQLLLTGYLDRADFTVSVLGSNEDLVTDSGVIPHHWVLQMLPRLNGTAITLGGPSTLNNIPSAPDRTESDFSFILEARGYLGSRNGWHLVCDIEETIRDVKYDLDVYPELANYGATISAIREKIIHELSELYRRGCVVSPHTQPPSGWGFSETDYKDVYVLGWEDRRLTYPSGGPTAFAERLCAMEDDVLQTGIIIPYRCPENNQCRHFVSRMILELGYGAPTFQKNRMLLATRNYRESSAIASLVETFAIAFMGVVGGKRIVVKTIKRVSPTPPDTFQDAKGDQRSIYLDIDSEDIYVYSVMLPCFESFRLNAL